MRKTLSVLLLLFASIAFLPQNAIANHLMESAIYEAKYGDKDLVKFYPNPMVSDASIQISEDIDLERSKVSLEFYNIVGSEVYRISLVKDYEQKITRDIFRNPGIYFYQLKVDDRVVSTGRITVK